MKVTFFKRLKNSLDDLGGRKALIRASGLTKGKVLDIGIGECG